jgi:hypothetical protein
MPCAQVYGSGNTDISSLPPPPPTGFDGDGDRDGDNQTPGWGCLAAVVLLGVLIVSFILHLIK